MKFSNLNKESLVLLLTAITKEYPQVKYQLQEMFKEISK